jgi:hypothetical protein
VIRQDTVAKYLDAKRPKVAKRLNRNLSQLQQPAVAVKPRD